eukprot:365687-Chlamydomonas_euryale.AAC.10
MKCTSAARGSTPVAEGPKRTATAACAPRSRPCATRRQQRNMALERTRLVACCCTSAFACWRHCSMAVRSRRTMRPPPAYSNADRPRSDYLNSRNAIQCFIVQYWNIAAPQPCAMAG